MSMFDLKSKKRPEAPHQVIDDKKPIGEPIHQEITPEQQFLNILDTLREIHEGACIITLLVTENEIQIQSTQKVVVSQPDPRELQK